MRTNAVSFVLKDNFTMPPMLRQGRPTVYPFAEMKMDQTALFSLKGKRDKIRIRAAISKISADKGLRFQTRTLTDGSFAVKRIRANAK